ncbi:hypothetical protein BHE74_00030442 [Ensete ventricosum]|nr:hypothetical protein BHE74_00030442 [Ensete ventricosum]
MTRRLLAEASRGDFLSPCRFPGEKKHLPTEGCDEEVGRGRRRQCQGEVGVREGREERRGMGCDEAGREATMNGAEEGGGGKRREGEGGVGEGGLQGGRGGQGAAMNGEEGGEGTDRHVDCPLPFGISLATAILREKRRRRKKENREKRENEPRRELFHALSRSQSDVVLP